MCEELSSNPWKRPYLQHYPFNRWRLPGQSHAARQNTNTAAIPSERNLQLRVNWAPPPRGEADPTPFGTQRCQKGMSLESVRRCVMAKSERCVQGPCETCETLSFFHECGRRVGMVPRSSLKEGKKGRWWRMERRPQKTNPKPNTQARRPTPPSCSLPYTLGETCETETSDN